MDQRAEGEEVTARLRDPYPDFSALVEQLHQILGARNGARDTQVHAVRVTCKRLRALCRLARNRRLASRLRRLGRAFAAERDAAKVNEILLKMGSTAQVPVPVTPVSLAQVMAEFRSAALELDNHNWKKGQLRRALRRSIRRFRRARRTCRKPGASSADFHRWRKRTKDLVYQLEFARAFGLRKLPKKSRLARLGEVLGDAHDDFLLAEFFGQSRAPDTLRMRMRLRRRLAQDHADCLHRGKLVPV